MKNLNLIIEDMSSILNIINECKNSTSEVLRDRYGLEDLVEKLQNIEEKLDITTMRLTKLINKTQI